MLYGPQAVLGPRLDVLDLNQKGPRWQGSQAAAGGVGQQVELCPLADADTRTGDARRHTRSLHRSPPSV